MSVAIGRYPSLKSGWHFTMDGDFPVIPERYSARVLAWFGGNSYSICEYASSSEKPWRDFMDWDDEENDYKAYGPEEVLAWRVIPVFDIKHISDKKVRDFHILK